MTSLSEKQKELLQILLDDPMKFAIVDALDLLGSMNLKEIAAYLDKKEPFIHRFIKGYVVDGEVRKTGMLEEGLIEIDTDATNKKRGKYYQKSEDVRVIYKSWGDEEILTEVPEDISQILGDSWVDDPDNARKIFIRNVKKKEGTRHVAKGIAELGYQTHANYAVFINRQFELAVEEAYKEKPDFDIIDPFLYGNLTSSSGHVKFGTRQQLHEFDAIFAKFLMEVREFGKRCKIENEELIEKGKITADMLRSQYLYFYISPLIKP